MDEDATDTEPELTAIERAELDAWSPLAPPPDFVERVLAADVPKVARRSRRALVVSSLAAVVAAAAIALVVIRSPHRAAGGTVSAATRTSTALGDRGVAVAEPDAALTWRVDDQGAAEVEQRAGNVFYRIERGEAFVVHTPAGDVRVAGTCFRVEVEPMKPSHKMLLSGAIGAALATAVLITVYEGHVVAETKSARAELPAGTRATLLPDGTLTTTGVVAAGVAAADAPLDVAHATREELIARTARQQEQLIRLRNRIGELEHASGPEARVDDGRTPEPGRPWHEPSPERLAQWAAECHVSVDEPGLDAFTPRTSAEDVGRGLEPKELDGYNAALTEVARPWQALVRALYSEATGDTAGAETLSIEAMRREIEDKSPPGEAQLLMEKLAAERAGLLAPPPSTAKLSPLERLWRAYQQLGDQTEAALGKRVGDKRAHELRGDAWQGRHDHSGCPEKK